MEYFFAISGLMALCGGWIYFQLWLEKHDPDRKKYKPGCGSCTQKCDQNTQDQE